MAASIRKIFAANLRRLIRQNGLKQKELAEKLNVTESLVSTWLHARSFPEEKNFDLICEKFNLEPVDLFRDPEKQKYAKSELIAELARQAGYELTRKPGSN